MLARGSRKSSVIYPPLITFGSCSVQEDARFWVLQLILPSRQVIFIPTPREGGRAVSINHPTEDMLCWTRPRRTKEWIFPPPLSSPCTDPTFKVSRCLRCSLMEQQYIKKRTLIIINSHREKRRTQRYRRRLRTLKRWEHHCCLFDLTISYFIHLHLKSANISSTVREHLTAQSLSPGQTLLVWRMGVRLSHSKQE